MQKGENPPGIKFDYYVLTGFQQVTQAVNQIGGLEVNVPYSVVGYQQTFPSGLHRMTGQEVLGYSRTRHSLPLGDFDRSSTRAWCCSAPCPSSAASTRRTRPAFTAGSAQAFGRCRRRSR